MMSFALRFSPRVLMLMVAVAIALSFLIPTLAVAQDTGTSETTKPVSAGKPGDVSAGIKKALDKMNGLRSGLIQGAVSLSDRTRGNADKIAFGLGVIALVLAGLRFGAAGDAVKAWTELFETLLVVGIFSAIYVNYTTFGPAIFTWFAGIAESINGGDDIYNVPISISKTAGSFFDSVCRIVISNATNPLKWIEAIASALLFFIAFIAVLVSALIYFWFILLGHLQVAIGIVVGPLAVALGMFDMTRRYFTAWLDYMVTGSLYMVIAATISQLVSASLLSIVTDVGNVGTDTFVAAGYATSTAIMLVFIALEIPKVAGSIFGTGGGVSGASGLKGLGRGAWNLGQNLAGGGK
ncbi:type IV secretion system protein [Cupriavidus numazuensis]|uniref:Uncharacterized protein n=1 Tax=Cupriavidus numazuensis TaxID=221992 RepID=A0ABN7Q6W3_9BURK|nr:type IV secretion system protein [Cupriavidus numazuensis]CAG2155403.1 hypothetical protein LMG26411_04929 [Cupriavidus numazuensis]